MTKQAVTADAVSQYGLPELRGLYQRHATIALAIAVAAHLAAIGCFFLAGMISPDAEPIRTIRKIQIWELGPSPSIMNGEPALQARIAASSARATAGVPVPVPDVGVSAEQTIASQTELSNPAGPVSGSGTRTGNVPAEPDVTIEDEDPPPFLAVEMLPVPVKVVTPEYPDIARRAGMEGTVWVRILVDKEGKARKAFVVKSDQDIFNEPAVRAALQFVFTPAMMNNGPVAVWAAMPFRFRLNK